MYRVLVKVGKLFDAGKHFSSEQRHSAAARISVHLRSMRFVANELLEMAACFDWYAPCIFLIFQSTIIK